MHHVRSLIFIFAFSFVAGSAFAGLAVSPGTPAHTHTDANTGGSTLDVGSFRITSADSRTIFIESDATTDNKRWDWQANAESFLLRTVDDAGAVAGTAVKVDRTGTVVDEISLSATNTSVTGTLSVTDTVSSTKSCFTGYTRVSPNFCIKDAPSTVFNLSAGGCTLTTAPGPTDVEALLLTISQRVISTNAVGLRDATLNVYAPTDTTCAGGGQIIPVSMAREEVAVAAGTELSRHTYQITVRSSATGVVPVQWVSGGIVTGDIAGYYD